MISEESKSSRITPIDLTPLVNCKHRPSFLAIAIAQAFMKGGRVGTLVKTS